MQDVKLPAFSLVERDRRYQAVRYEMAARGIDCLIAPQNTGEWDACQPDARYLTSIGGGGTAVAAFDMSSLYRLRTQVEGKAFDPTRRYC